VRPEPLEERRKRLAKLLSRKSKAMDDGIQLREAITGDGVAIFRHACWMDFEGIVSKRIGSRYVSGRARAWLKTKDSAAAYCRFGHDPPWSGVLTCSAGHVV
jgi:bifunctional non-homologous end joining protein LigD